MILNQNINQKKIITFGELIEHWFSTWSTTVKPNTVKRERLVLNRLSEMLPNDILLEVITPLLIRNSLEEYRVKYNASHSTMQLIKSTLNMVLNGIKTLYHTVSVIFIFQL